MKSMGYKAALKSHHFLIPLVTGVFTPSLAILVLEVFVGKISPISSIQGMIQRLFEDGQNLFFFMLITMVPFIASIVLTLLASFFIKGKRLECIFWGGFIPVFALTFLFHYDIWLPLYVPGRHMSSTAVIGFLFVPMIALVGLVVGAVIGWVISLFPAFGESPTA